MSQAMDYELSNRLKRFFRADKGNISLMAAAALIPLFGAAGMAIDVLRISNAKTDIQFVADSGALAAVRATGTDAERAAKGLAFINSNMNDMPGVTAKPSVKVSNDTAEVSIEAEMPTTLTSVLFASEGGGAETGDEGAAFNGDSMRVKIVSSAAMALGEPRPRCLATLDPTMADALYIRGTGDLTSVNCDVHVDSNHASMAMHLQGDAEAFVIGGDFTVVGNYDVDGGNGFTPDPKPNSDFWGDPFSITVTPPAGPYANISIGSGASLATRTLGEAGEPKYFNNLTMNGAHVFMMPGTYYVTGTIDFRSDAWLTANGVTIVLTGPNARITMGAQGTMDLTAPSIASGLPFPGFAVIQNPLSATNTLANQLNGGSGTDIIGIWYTKHQKLNFIGNSNYNLSSDYFPVIVDNMEIGGGGNVTIEFDYAQYGFPNPLQLYYTPKTGTKLTQ